MRNKSAGSWKRTKTLRSFYESRNGKRDVRDVMKELEIERDIKKFIESLILAQDERWRRA